MSQEKVDMLKAFGAKVHICPSNVSADSPESYYETGKRLHRETPNAYWLGQYFNLNNVEAHYRTTGPEIWRQTGGQIDVLVGGIGTGGTISGTARFLKEMLQDIEVVAADPVGSIYYNYHKNKSLVDPNIYMVEGIGDDMLCPTVDFSVIDSIYQVTDEECFKVGRELTRREGIFGGGSSGAAVHVALKHAVNLDADKTMVVILPDSGMKYMSKMYSDDWMRERGFLQ
jgi:cystathionine beta-synthase